MRGHKCQGLHKKLAGMSQGTAPRDRYWDWPKCLASCQGHGPTKQHPGAGLVVSGQLYVEELCALGASGQLGSSCHSFMYELAALV